MKTIKFREVLNELVSCFLLGDPITLKNYKEKHHLPDDLATEFTTNESGDRVITEGIVIALSEIENYPYTIIFNFMDEAPELLKPENQLQIRQGGYVLKIENECLMLYGFRVLNHFTDEKIRELMQYQTQYNRPQVRLENGWYQVEILGGETLQQTTFTNEQGEKETFTDFEPTLEFLIQPIAEKAPCTADIFRSYRIEARNY